MTARRPPVSFGIVLLAGVGIGWGLASRNAPKLLANGADRWGDRALAAGPIAVEMTADKIPIAQDALYYLNYSTGKLLSTIPTYQQTVSGTQVFTEFAERDLIADFGIKPGMNPHFLMTTGSLGMRSAGWSPLFVVETESGQVATYKVTAQSTPGSTRPSFQLLDRHTDARLGRAITAGSR
ncbi:MAG: hypothetical protein JWN86_3698 [Planctomycetota bacterium]|nr:hypothetical protein [Planctomycetota bacterium]